MGSLDFPREKETVGVKLLFCFHSVITTFIWHHLYGKGMKLALVTRTGLMAWLVSALQCLQRPLLRNTKGGEQVILMPMIRSLP